MTEDEERFRRLTDPYRRELQLHCYRILGSIQDAEDLLQETLLAAWRGFDRFEGRSSVRTWLYRIATNRCLNALRDSGRRPQEVSRPMHELPEPTRMGEPIWLEPCPDDLLEALPDTGGPEARYETKESVTLAFMVALQQLPPLQRAVLVLRDVLGFHADEVAEMLQSTTASVNSGLQRARTSLDGRLPVRRERAPLPRSASEGELVDRFVEALVNDDIDGVVALLADDAILNMPPEPMEYEGPDAIRVFLADRAVARGGRAITLVPTRANTQPAFGFYIADGHAAVSRCVGVLVLTLSGDRIVGLTRFGPSGVLPFFGLPRTLPSASRRSSPRTSPRPAGT